MKRLVFDIETTGVPFESLDEETKKFVFKYAETPAEKRQAKEMLGISPFTGKIIAIALLDYETNQGGVYFQAPDKKKLKETVTDGVRYVPATEQGILERFWDVARRYDQFITFNGRSFDAPYIYIRSMAHNLPATKNLMPNRYAAEHIDLMDQLKFYGAMRTRFNFDIVCKALGITSPKSNGVTGFDVPKLFKQKKYLEIARYCMDDVRATRELYIKWTHLKSGVK